MKIEKLKPKSINQNGYNTNIFTKYRIGTLFIYPTDYTPDDCFSCDGYSLLITDYEELYKVVGTKFNKSGDASGTFRIPDYNITGRFLQPGSNVGTQIEAGLPDHNHTVYTPLRMGDSDRGSGSSSWSVDSVYLSTTSNASTSNSIYGKNSTVQPPSQIVHICIKYK